jgi:hypothetical protein
LSFRPDSDSFILYISVSVLFFVVSTGLY